MRADYPAIVSIQLSVPGLPPCQRELTQTTDDGFSVSQRTVDRPMATGCGQAAYCGAGSKRVSKSFSTARSTGLVKWRSKPASLASCLWAGLP